MNVIQELEETSIKLEVVRTKRMDSDSTKSEIYNEDSDYDSEVMNSLYSCSHALRKMGCKISKNHDKVIFTDMSGFLKIDGTLNVLAPKGCTGVEIENIILDVCKNILGNVKDEAYPEEIKWNDVLSIIEESVSELYASLKNDNIVPTEFKIIGDVVCNLSRVECTNAQKNVRSLSSLYQDLKSLDKIELTGEWSSEMILLYKLCLVLVCNHRIAEKLGLPITDVLLFPSSFAFERFVCNRVKECLEPTYVVEPQQYHGYLSKAPDKKPVGIRPDITVFLDSKAILVIDSKYKAFNRKMSYPDLHQMSTYISVLETRTGILVYPYCKNMVDFEECDDTDGIGFCKMNVMNIGSFYKFVQDCLNQVRDGFNL